MSAGSFFQELGDEIKIVAEDAAKVAPQIAAVAGLIYPPAAPLFSGISGLLQSVVINTESVSNNSDKQMSGDAKQQFAASDFDNAFSLTSQIIARVQPGQMPTYDAKLRDQAIKSCVQSLNDMAALVGSVKLIPAVTK